MRKISLIILHCSATREDQRYTAVDCRRDHVVNKGWTTMGYHYYIERDGSIHQGCPEEFVGNHCRDHNKHSIGICYEGGLDKNGQCADTRTEAQKRSLMKLLAELMVDYPHALIEGHRDLNKYKACPCFDAAEYRQIFNKSSN